MLPAFLNQSLFLDLETSEQEKDRVLKIGAVLGGEVFERKGSFLLGEALESLDRMAAGAERVLGHNLIDHDLPVLARIAPALRLHGKPVVDTLFLSPLAFPENPYHRLVKDYKLVRDAVNDPVADARLAASVFEDQWRSFSTLAAREPDQLAFYAFCLDGLLAEVFQAVSGRPAMGIEEAEAHLESLAETACWTALRTEGGDALAWPDGRIAWAYAAAWLRVAGGNSVLPPWVRHRYPATPALLSALRDRPCADPACSYCRRVHDPRAQLRRFFDLEGFRPTPALPDGRGLQQAVAERGLAGDPLLAILATGGGKSLCYQLPALVRYFRRGVLTVVLSPLQALMQDQVENLNQRTGSGYAAALNGLLTPPERGSVLERVRLGEVAILYVAPEQLRNRSFRETVRQREIGGWVFDEAHCLSKWGHDFRPDYLYAARFIRDLAKSQEAAVPPVSCFTATAKRDVKEEILDHFRRELEMDLVVFERGVQRDELAFQVARAHSAEKLPRIFEILSDTLGRHPEGSAVVYFASRRGSAEAARFLTEKGLPAEAFHAGLEAPEKRRILESFVAGSVPVVCATNAFGMGIDKDNVRLVLHAEMPSSLENYLQEAGRAGRDRLPSDCVLLFDDDDMERQFKLASHGRLSQRDITQILRGLRSLARRSKRDEVEVTSGELLREEDVETDFGPRDWSADTKVKTAVAWLERAELIERGENRTRLFQGRLRVRGLDEARQRIAALGNAIPERTAERWLVLLEALINADPTRGLTADELAELPGLKLGPGSLETSRGERILRLLQGMAESGLIQGGLQLTAYLERRGRRPSRTAFEALIRLEQALLDILREADPEAGDGSWLDLSLRLVNQRLLDQGLSSHPETLRQLLRGLAREGTGTAGQPGILELAYRSRHHYRARLIQGWEEVLETAGRRRATANVVLDTLLSRVPQETTGRYLVEFALEDLTDALGRDLFLNGQIPDRLTAAERSLLFLHEQGVLQLQQGLAVFRQAMTLRLPEKAKGQRYTQGDYAALSQHYDERTFQIHVMARYARLGLTAIRNALSLVDDYFLLGKASFVRRHFAGDGEALRRATSPESYHKIAESLGHPVQTALVSAPVDRNLLILAGPGSGKTRVVVHRCAYLLRVARVPARGILVLCFNRNAALELRRRLRDLVGDEARGVTIQTYHGLALRLTGHSLAAAARQPGELELDRYLEEAVRLLEDPESAADAAAIPSEELRERLLAGYSHILVDEYQDINARQYELVSAIAGRTLADSERQLTILAVGDDDQTIYGFQGANADFIRRFQEDYKAEVHYLVESFRSTGHILASANRLIAANGGRLKEVHPIRVNQARQDEPAGERVEILEVADAGRQAAAIAWQLERLRSLNPQLAWRDCAVLARGWRTLSSIRAVLEENGLPVSWSPDREKLPPLRRVREIAGFLAALEARKPEPCHVSQLEDLARRQAFRAGAGNPWWPIVFEILAEWREEVGNAEAGAAAVLEHFQEALAERSRSPAFGEGVHLMTAHGAKGLEFPHVFLADGEWHSRPQEEEEERRLYYVGMTRARETLHLLWRRDERNAHVPLLRGAPETHLRHLHPPEPPEPIRRRRFELLGLSGLHLSYAGHHPPDHPVHEALARLQPGDPLQVVETGNGSLHLQIPSGLTVARLSKKGNEDWRNRTEAIEKARVVALVEWKAESRDPTYQERLRCERWEVPVVEIVYADPKA